MLVDISHAVPAQNVLAAAILLADTLQWFPDHAVHIGVVDPGVGTGRRLLAGRYRGGWFVGPDNGLFSLCEIRDVVALENPEFWAPQVSHTFHGRDIMAPVAAAIVAGVPLRRLGPQVEDWVTVRLPVPVARDRQLLGQVIHVDSFGNLITNLVASQIGPDSQVKLGSQTVPLVRCYGEAGSGDIVALIGSGGRLEIAVVNGNAARRLGRDHIVLIMNPSSET